VCKDVATKRLPEIVFDADWTTEFDLIDFLNKTACMMLPRIQILMLAIYITF
jgi:hypothetical protein